MADPDWREFEKFVAKLHQSPGVVVEHDVQVKGASGCEYQVDVRVTYPAPAPQPSFVVLISCKEWKARVDRPAVVEFKGTVEDCRASRGVMFSASGFSEEAATYAKFHSIELFHLAELGDASLGDFIRRVEITGSLHAPHLDGLLFKVPGVPPPSLKGGLYRHEADLFDETGAVVGNVLDILNRELPRRLEDRDGEQTFDVDFPPGSRLLRAGVSVFVNGARVTGHRTVSTIEFAVDLADVVRAALINITTKEQRWVRHDGTLSKVLT